MDDDEQVQVARELKRLEEIEPPPQPLPLHLCLDANPDVRVNRVQLAMLRVLCSVEDNEMLQRLIPPSLCKQLTLLLSRFPKDVALQRWGLALCGTLFARGSERFAQPLVGEASQLRAGDNDLKPTVIHVLLNALTCDELRASAEVAQEALFLAHEIMGHPLGRDGLFNRTYNMFGYRQREETEIFSLAQKKSEHKIAKLTMVMQLSTKFIQECVFKAWQAQSSQGRLVHQMKKRLRGCARRKAFEAVTCSALRAALRHAPPGRPKNSNPAGNGVLYWCMKLMQRVSSVCGCTDDVIGILGAGAVGLTVRLLLGPPHAEETTLAAGSAALGILVTQSSEALHHFRLADSKPLLAVMRELGKGPRPRTIGSKRFLNWKRKDLTLAEWADLIENAVEVGEVEAALREAEREKQRQEEEKALKAIHDAKQYEESLDAELEFATKEFAVVKFKAGRCGLGFDGITVVSVGGQAKEEGIVQEGWKFQKVGGVKVNSQEDVEYQLSHVAMANEPYEIVFQKDGGFADIITHSRSQSQEPSRVGSRRPSKEATSRRGSRRPSKGTSGHVEQVPEGALDLSKLESKLEELPKGSPSPTPP